MYVILKINGDRNWRWNTHTSLTPTSIFNSLFRFKRVLQLKLFIKTLFQTFEPQTEFRHHFQFTLQYDPITSKFCCIYSMIYHKNKCCITPKTKVTMCVKQTKPTFFPSKRRHWWKWDFLKHISWSRSEYSTWDSLWYKYKKKVHASFSEPHEISDLLRCQSNSINSEVHFF